ncbi:MAG: site-specific DNA-methyltransferase [Chthoniobacterales bacterium]|nr:site-specific DNA-methyltransferase [Chthoniobacterales bacterium]
MPSLNWIGKEAVINHHLEVPFRLLKDVPDLACGDPGSGNLIVEGDNLVGLKALLPYYAGKVKCVCIDPPYNTGNEGWVYNDNVNSPLIREWLGKVVGKEGETLDRHDRWLCMMYPRLALLKQFLSEDGSIWIHMDDSEIGLLRVVMDEIFGAHRFVACNVWQKRYSRENREAIGDVHEYLMVYAMDPERFKETRNKVGLEEKQRSNYKNPNNDPNGPWQSISMTAQGWRPNQMYEIVAPNGTRHKPPEGRCWSLIESEYLKLCAENRLWWGKDGNGVPRQIRYLKEVEGLVPWTWWTHEEVGHTDEARKEVQSIFGTQTAFDTPKPSRLIERILQIATNPGDLVLDSFGGSGTTAHAVLKLNAAERSRTESTEDTEKETLEKTSVSSASSVRTPLPNRRFILIELEERVAREVTAGRVRRVAEGYTSAKGESVAGLGGGFRFCELGEPLFDEAGQIRATVRFADLARHVYFTETGEPLIGSRTENTEDTEKELLQKPSVLSVSSVRISSPLLGVCRGVGIYLLYNGILGDKSASGGNVLTRAVLTQLPPFDGPKVVYCAGCLLGPERLAAHRITVRQTPYEIRAT